MEIILLLLIAGIIFLGGVLVGGFMYYLKHTGRINLTATNQQRAREREAAKELILKLFRSKEQIYNRDIRHFLGVSDRSAHRYLEELVRDGRLTQHKERGRGVFYTQQG